MYGRRLKSAPAAARGLALMAVATLLACGCGASGGGGRPEVKPVGSPGKASFPSLGYRAVAPRLPAGARAGAALVVDLTNTGSIAPGSMRVASDATAAGLRWSRWGSEQTTGRGTATVRICTTSCGAGKNRDYPATITLTGLKRCRTHRFYERAQMRLRTAHGSQSWGAFVRVPC